jgi:hypothetical protein
MQDLRKPSVKTEGFRLKLIRTEYLKSVLILTSNKIS